MHRIDGQGATEAGLFTEGNPQTGTPATVVTADWLNDVQENLATVIEEAEPLEKGNYNQLLLAINTLIAAAVGGSLAYNDIPVGGIIFSAEALAMDSRFLVCDGSAISRAAYNDLFMVIGTTFGPGNGTTTFNLPDLVDDFIRGAGPGRPLGTRESDQNKAHQHEHGFAANGAADQGRFGAGTTTTPDSRLDIEGTGVLGGAGALVSPSGGTEARPRNVALFAVICYESPYF